MVATRHRKISHHCREERKSGNDWRRRRRRERRKNQTGRKGGKKSRNDKEESEKKALLALQASKAHLTVVCRPNEWHVLTFLHPFHGKGERNRAGNSGGKWPDLTNMAAGGRSNGEHAERTLCRSWRQRSSGAPTPGERTAEPCRDVPQLPHRRFCESRKLSGYVLMKTHVRERAWRPRQRGKPGYVRTVLRQRWWWRQGKRCWRRLGKRLKLLTPRKGQKSDFVAARQRRDYSFTVIIVSRGVAWLSDWFSAAQVPSRLLLYHYIIRPVFSYSPCTPVDTPSPSAHAHFSSSFFFSFFVRRL